MRLSGGNITIDVPVGWDAHIYQRSDEILATDRAQAQLQEEATTHSVLHAATFPLPEVRGDYGGGAVEQMSRSDAMVILFEFHPDSAGTGLFREVGYPWPLRIDEFDPQQMQRPLPGASGLQRFFQVSGRAFCLYVPLGSQSDALVGLVNQVLATVEIGARE